MSDNRGAQRQSGVPDGLHLPPVLPVTRPRTTPGLLTRHRPPRRPRSTRSPRARAPRALRHPPAAPRAVRRSTRPATDPGAPPRGRRLRHPDRRDHRRLSALPGGHARRALARDLRRLPRHGLGARAPQEPPAASRGVQPRARRRAGWRRARSAAHRGRARLAPCSSSSASSRPPRPRAWPWPRNWWPGCAPTIPSRPKARPGGSRSCASSSSATRTSTSAISSRLPKPNWRRPGARRARAVAARWREDPRFLTADPSRRIAMLQHLRQRYPGVEVNDLMTDAVMAQGASAKPGRPPPPSRPRSSVCSAKCRSRTPSGRSRASARASEREAAERRTRNAYRDATGTAPPRTTSLPGLCSTRDGPAQAPQQSAPQPQAPQRNPFSEKKLFNPDNLFQHPKR